MTINRQSMPISPLAISLTSSICSRCQSQEAQLTCLLCHSIDYCSNCWKVVHATGKFKMHYPSPVKDSQYAQVNPQILICLSLSPSYNPSLLAREPVKTQSKLLNASTSMSLAETRIEMSELLAMTRNQLSSLLLERQQLQQQWQHLQLSLYEISDSIVSLLKNKVNSIVTELKDKQQCQMAEGNGRINKLTEVSSQLKTYLSSSKCTPQNLQKIKAVLSQDSSEKHSHLFKASNDCLSVMMDRSAFEYINKQISSLNLKKIIQRPIKSFKEIAQSVINLNKTYAVKKNQKHRHGANNKTIGSIHTNDTIVTELESCKSVRNLQSPNVNIVRSNQIQLLSPSSCTSLTDLQQPKLPTNTNNSNKPPPYQYVKTYSKQSSSGSLYRLTVGSNRRQNSKITSFN